jgi:putative OPT family oligopeptide transporter
VLDLLAHAFGFAGAPNLDTVTAQPLAAPQASLISALAQGVIGGKLNWTMIGIGALLGAGLVALDEFLGWRKWLHLPPLAIGIGIYLPMSATLPVVVGAVIGHWYVNWTKRTKDPAHSEQLGVLVASGMIVGESLFGVVLAGLIVGFSNDAPLALVGADYPWANIIGVATFVALIVILYGWMMKRSRAVA